MNWQINSLAAANGIKKLSQRGKNVLILGFLGMSLGLFVFLVLELSQVSNAASEKGEAEDLGSLQKQVAERRKELDDKEKFLAERERELTNKQKLLEEQVKSYEKEMDRLKSKVSELEELKKGNIEALKNVYERMEPKKAATILGEMNPNVSSRLLTSLKSERAAEILGKMDPDKAKKITEKLATH